METQHALAPSEATAEVRQVHQKADRENNHGGTTAATIPSITPVSNAADNCGRTRRCSAVATTAITTAHSAGVAPLTSWSPQGDDEAQHGHLWIGHQ